MITAKHLLTVSFGAIGFYLFGYGVAFGDGNKFMGHQFIGLKNLDTMEYGHWFFEFAVSI